ncbi:hypothetical protein [Actinopolymorpha pittospori]|uniref:Uncharacterized protein n=1 Tax=Actinopolymorpha pittospori TaxID=648752 RepID=A0A927RC08_9ACTN|nr:hypothetical protein [Actinopolymorpha pittospori]MBE1609364.1 hypothetical protein [Actinopolymorpha pittospori]
MPPPEEIEGRWPGPPGRAALFPRPDRTIPTAEFPTSRRSPMFIIAVLFPVSAVYTILTPSQMIFEGMNSE